MEQIKLISAITFGEKVENRLISLELDYKDYFMLRSNFDNFLKQTPNIGHFIPAKLVDGVWIVLEEPKKPHTCSSENAGEYWDKYSKELKEYNEAKNRVIFNGWVIGGDNLLTNTFIDFWYDDFGIFELNQDHTEIQTIEQLIQFNLQLTEQKAKELGL